MLLRFLQTLHDSGRAKIAQPDENLLVNLHKAGKEPLETQKIRRMLENWHKEALLDLPGPEINFQPEAAIWGGTLLFRAAFLTSFREIEASAIYELLQNDPMPDDANPSAHFSADLCLCHWPVIYRMARSRSEDDPLVKAMLQLAEKFPLSSLGMNVGISQDSPLLHHAGLRQFFAERALERADHTCLAVPEISSFIRFKLGAYSANLDRGLLPTLPVS